MCLATVSVTTEIPHDEPITAYKVMHKRLNESYGTPCRNEHREYILGRTYHEYYPINLQVDPYDFWNAFPEIRIDYLPFDTYQSGFHAFLTPKDAERFATDFLGVQKGVFNILEVKLSGKLTFGLQDSGIMKWVGGVVAERMTLVKERS